MWICTFLGLLLMQTMPAVWTLLERRNHMVKEANLDRELIDIAEHAANVWASVISANQRIKELRVVCATAKSVGSVIGTGAVVASGVVAYGAALRIYQDAQLAGLKLRLMQKGTAHRQNFVASPKRGVTDLCRVPGPLQLNNQHNLVRLSHNDHSNRLFGGFRLLHHKGTVQWIFENNNVRPLQ
jgi:hypothetical protein